MQVTSQGLQEIDSCSQSAKTVFAEESQKHAEDIHRFISISSGLGDTLRNRLEDSLEPIRLNAANNLPPEHLARFPKRLGRAAPGARRKRPRSLHRVLREFGPVGRAIRGPDRAAELVEGSVEP